MSYIDPSMQDRFDSLSKELQEEIMKQNTQIRTLQDLIQSLEKITAQN